MFDFKKLILSFGHAVNGVKAAMDDQSFRIQVVIGAVVFALAFYFRLQKFEFLILILTVISVLTLEMINTSIERILDLLGRGFARRFGGAGNRLKNFHSLRFLAASPSKACKSLRFVLS
ncbi:MAG: Prokaryotic diacylglycerol kinase [Candidatus Azambacteria bacterium GW2011_GWE2_46_45]|uniref:Prokaryotic diacylglycerol kinase n=1 Tax=Candidatus Azambacteria bacterium GW2011_GWE2_46_45 TaxID=1618625 RepID=A0A0G1SAB9_9BACT|nr:MAG: Prokaryotic diacylglycerol kinase [Candidatus Azambacteria bacterium GW2011_GWE2_46_45]